MTHVRENRVFLHGDECVVGKYVLAYLGYYTVTHPLNQFPVLDFYVNRGFIYKIYPHILFIYPQLYRGTFWLWITPLPYSPVLPFSIFNLFMVVENFSSPYSRR